MVSSPEHRQLRDSAYALSTTLVRDEVGLLPLKLAQEEQLLIVYPLRENWTQVEDRRYPLEFFVESISHRHARTISRSITPASTEDDYEELLQVARTSAVMIVVTVNAYLDTQQVDLLHQLLQINQPMVGIAVYNPYDLLAFPELPTYLVTYECTEPALAAVVHVLFGDGGPHGQLPVSLPGLYPLDEAG